MSLAENAGTSIFLAVYLRVITMAIGRDYNCGNARSAVTFGKTLSSRREAIKRNVHKQDGVESTPWFCCDGLRVS